MVKDKRVRVPIFPLANSIIFPGVYLHLHIFEDRYKHMLRDLLSSGSELAISYSPELQPGQHYPSRICGVGPVKVLQTNPNGESDIVVFGLRRVRFESFAQEVPYLIGEGELLEIDREMPKSTHDQLLHDIQEMLINWVFSNYEDSTRAIQMFKEMKDLEILSNFVVFYFVQDMEQKQKMLEENSLEVKAQFVWQTLKDFDGSDAEVNLPLGPSDDAGPGSTSIN